VLILSGVVQVVAKLDEYIISSHEPTYDTLMYAKESHKATDRSVIRPVGFPPLDMKAMLSQTNSKCITGSF
jgi:hypothetical protein